MVKIIALITKLPTLTRTEFLHAWQVEHPPIIWDLPGLRRYVQSPSAPGSRTWDYDGAAELWFDSVKDVAIAFSSEAAAPMHEHESHFIHQIVWFLADEVEVPDPRPGAMATASAREVRS